MPGAFDLFNPAHVDLLDQIRSAYGEHLGNESHPYGQCMFQPSSVLPYPKRDIQNALTALLSFVEGRAESPFLDDGIKQPEEIGRAHV